MRIPSTSNEIIILEKFSISQFQKPNDDDQYNFHKQFFIFEKTKPQLKAYNCQHLVFHLTKIPFFSFLVLALPSPKRQQIAQYLSILASNFNVLISKEQKISDKRRKRALLARSTTTTTRVVPRAI